MRAKCAYIRNFEATCPICKTVNYFRFYTKEEDSYYNMTMGQLELISKCEHYTNHYRDGAMKARFIKQ